MKKLVFDIETVGVEFDSLDAISKEYLLKYAEDEEEKQDIKERLGFYPHTGFVVAIGVYNPDTNQGGILLNPPEGIKEAPEKLNEDVTLEWGSEKEILEKFWDICNRYNYFISFNGRGFDVPFLMIRSAIHGITPSKDLMSNRYVSSQKFGATHVDLSDQLKFYGAFRRTFPLHIWCKAFGIESPKEEGITGDDVAPLYKKKKMMEIAHYNSKDLTSTAELYRRWHEYLEKI